MNRKLLNRIRENFQEALQTKTGWGRNEILVAFDQAVAQACLEMLDEAEKENKS